MSHIGLGLYTSMKLYRIATMQLDASVSTDKVSYSFFFYKTFREIDEDTSFIDRPDVKVRNGTASVWSVVGIPCVIL